MLAICDLLAGDRIGIYSELEKLITYVGERQFITEEDVINCFTGNNKSNYDDIYFAFADKNTERFILLLEQQLDPFLIVRSLSQYLIRLQQVLSTPIENREGLIKNLKPPVFF